MFKHQAIYNTHATVKSIIDDIPKDIEGNIVVLNQSLVDKEESVLIAANEANQYQRQRATDYPSLQDQADMQYWDSVNGTTTWLDAINEIKTRYPKP